MIFFTSHHDLFGSIPIPASIASPSAELSWILFLFLLLVPELQETVQNGGKGGKWAKFAANGFIWVDFIVLINTDGILRRYTLSFTAAEIQHEQSLFIDVILHRGTYREINCLLPLKCEIFLCCSITAKFASGFLSICVFS